MAANIEIRTIDGVETASFIENGRQERAWHRLGTVYDRPLTAAEALEGAHADFDVSLQPIAMLTPEIMKMVNSGSSVSAELLKKYIIENRMATVRTDLNETLGIVSDAYGVVQNKHAFDFVDMLTTGELGGETPTIECAGMLGKGERIFITAKFPEPIRMAGNDKDVIDMYIVFTTSHDGSGAVNCMITPTRVVCNNTLNYAMSHNSGKLSLRHSANVMSRLDLANKDNAVQAYAALNLYNTYKAAFEDKLSQLATIKVNDKEIEDILVHSVLTTGSQNIYDQCGKNINCDDMPTRAKHIIETLQESLHSGVGQQGLQPGTGLWLINGLTSHFQNHYDWKGNNEKKFQSIMEGMTKKRLDCVLVRLTSHNYDKRLAA